MADRHLTAPKPRADAVVTGGIGGALLIQLSTLLPPPWDGVVRYLAPTVGTLVGAVLWPRFAAFIGHEWRLAFWKRERTRARKLYEGAIKDLEQEVMRGAAAASRDPIAEAFHIQRAAELRLSLGHAIAAVPFRRPWKDVDDGPEAIEAPSSEPAPSPRPRRARRSE